METLSAPNRSNSFVDTTHDVILKPRSHTKSTWAQLKPTIIYLYLDCEMTLHEVRRKLENDYGFCGTEQMFKKRLKAWNVTKNTKATQKDAAIGSLLAKADGSRLSSLELKVLRHAKNRVKEGTLSGECFMQLVKRNELLAGRSNAYSVDQAGSLSFSLSLPSSLAETDLLLRALKGFVRGQGMTPTTAQWQSYSSIRAHLTRGICYWESNAFSAARRAFNNAGRTLLEALKGGTIPTLSLVIELGRYNWLSDCSAVRDQWRKYVAATAKEILPQGHPFHIIARCMQVLPDDDNRELAMWNSMLHECLPLGGDRSNDWWQIARHRLLHCEKSGFYELAKHYYHQTRHILAAAGQLSVVRELSLLFKLSGVYTRLGDLVCAKECAERMLNISSRKTSALATWYASEAMRCLAIIEEQEGNLATALSLRETAISDRLAVYGSKDHDTMFTYIKLLQFLQRNKLNKDFERVVAQYHELHSYLEVSTEGLWNVGRSME